MNIDKNNFFVGLMGSTKDSIEAGDKKVKVKWFYDEGKAGQIEDVVPGCGCTVRPNILKDKLVLYYNDNTSKNRVKENGGSTLVRKSVTVYFDDGKKLKVATPTGMKYNKDKASVSLTFELVVK